MVGTEINAVRRELLRLSSAGLLHKRHSGNRLYYEVAKDYMFLNPLTKILACEYGFGGEIVKHKTDLGDPRFAMVSLEFLKGRVSHQNQVDLILVGKVNLPFLAELVQKEQSRIEHEVNYMALSDEEFSFQKSKRDPLLMSAIGQARVILWGDEERYCGIA